MQGIVKLFNFVQGLRQPKPAAATSAEGSRSRLVRIRKGIYACVACQGPATRDD